MPPQFARVLVDERLAACVNVLPAMTSVYRWKGSVEEEREQQLVIKTTRDRVAALEARFHELHPYELAGVPRAQRRAWRPAAYLAVAGVSR